MKFPFLVSAQKCTSRCICSGLVWLAQRKIPHMYCDTDGNSAVCDKRRADWSTRKAVLVTSRKPCAGPTRYARTQGRCRHVRGTHYAMCLFKHTRCTTTQRSTVGRTTSPDDHAILCIFMWRSQHTQPIDPTHVI